MGIMENTDEHRQVLNELIEAAQNCTVKQIRALTNVALVLNLKKESKWQTHESSQAEHGEHE